MTHAGAPAEVLPVFLLSGLCSFGGPVAHLGYDRAGRNLPPGLLVVTGPLPYWHGIRRRAGFAAVISGINAAVVGRLGYAVISLITLGAIQAGSVSC